MLVWVFEAVTVTAANNIPRTHTPTPTPTHTHIPTHTHTHIPTHTPTHTVNEFSMGQLSR